MDVTSAVAAPGAARWRASAWDYLVILGWLAVLTVLGLGARLALPAPGPISPVAADAVAFGFSVLPVWAYLTVTEAGVRRGSWGKQRTGLAVVAGDGRRAGAGRVAVRNAVKLLPWQLAHVAVARIIAEVDAPVTVATTYGLSLLVPAVSLAIAWRDPAHRALHDLVAGTRVVGA
ncbi:RDD family protein [Modestobacter italicus]|uniref:RDD family protein n=1 Tax=Modestobacter italicus (strain DSM 44449 / CECT 9708 / BC 501) TaxID=2732864 RepID=UPI001C954151|nr:RDD family protein [Modestobacter italicus]